MALPFYPGPFRLLAAVSNKCCVQLWQAQYYFSNILIESNVMYKGALWFVIELNTRVDYTKCFCFYRFYIYYCVLRWTGFISTFVKNAFFLL